MVILKGEEVPLPSERQRSFSLANMIGDLLSACDPNPSWVLRYGVAAGSVLVSLALTLLLGSVIAPSVFPLFTAAVMISAWFGGLGPGLLTTTLSVIGIESLSVFDPFPYLDIHGYLRLALFVLVAVLISGLTAARKRAELALREAHGQLERRVEQRTAELAHANENLRLEVDERRRTEKENQTLLHDLGERVKELTTLHGAAHLLQHEDKEPAELLQEIAAMLPDTWQYPEITAARVTFDSAEETTANFDSSYQPKYRAEFATRAGKKGSIEAGFVAGGPHPAPSELCEDEKKLVASLAEMFQSYFQRREAAAQVAQVSRELTESNRELWRLQSEIKGVESLAALGRVTGTIAHELGTPLNSVLGYTQLLAQDRLTDTGRRRLETIEVQVKRMVGIINHYLTHVRNSFQRQQRVDINELIQETLVMLKPILQQHHLQVRTALADALPPLIGDGPSLQRVLINLFDNSIDATKAGGLITITSASSVASGTTGPGVVITVTDTGSGIPEEIRPKIFDMFVTTKAPGRGSGLGLAISQEIVQGHGGHLEIVSETGKGTSARIYLPDRREIPDVMSAGVRT